VSRGLKERASPGEPHAVLEHERYHVYNLDPLKVLLARGLAFRDHPALEPPAANIPAPAATPAQLPMAVPVVVGGDAACRDGC
jgi:hypothetical protein